MTGLVRRHGLVAYFLLTFALAWALQGVLAVNGTSLSDPSAAAWLIVLSVIPGAVAMLLARTAGPPAWSDLRSRITRWRVRPDRYLYPMALVGIAEVLAGVAFVLLGGDLTMQPLILLAAPVVLAAAFAEEIGWRGYALPAMLRTLRPITAAVLLGVIWGVWHVPGQLLDPTAENLAVVAAFCAQTIGLSIVLTWAIARGGWAVLVSAATHATWNVIGNAAPLTTIEGRALLAVAILSAAAVLIVTVGRDLGVTREPEPMPAAA